MFLFLFLSSFGYPSLKILNLNLNAPLKITLNGKVGCVGEKPIMSYGVSKSPSTPTLYRDSYSSTLRLIIKGPSNPCFALIMFTDDIDVLIGCDTQKGAFA